MTKDEEIKNLKRENEELKKSIEYYKTTILEKITEKSYYLESVKEDIDIYRKCKNHIDDYSKILDKIYAMRDTTIDIAQEKYPKLYKEFIRDVYDDNPLDVLRFINALIKEVLEKR
jgi:hypothetical protein